MSDTPFPDDLSADLRAYLESVPPVTAEMTERVAAANRALENDPTFQAEYLRDVISERDAEIAALRADVLGANLLRNKNNRPHGHRRIVP